MQLRSEALGPWVLSPIRGERLAVQISADASPSGVCVEAEQITSSGKNRPVGGGIGSHEGRELRQVGMDVIIGRRLFAAEHDKGIGIRRFGQGLAGPGAVKVDQRGAFV